MPHEEHSLEKLSPKFIISAGTQVVLKVSKALEGSEEFKKPGSVGFVLQSPPNNESPYVVQFTDGQTVKAYYNELVLRRKEVDNELSEFTEDLRPYIIYRIGNERNASMPQTTVGKPPHVIARSKRHIIFRDMDRLLRPM